jgi:hypothetical protein
MAGALASAIIAVSITVGVPAALPAKIQWSGAANGTLGEILSAWAERAGQPKPSIDPEVASYKIGAVEVAARDYCEASSRVVAALRHSPAHPEIRDCATTGQPLVVVATGANEQRVPG